MLVGTVFLGWVKSMHKQSIETEFNIFGIPLAPIDSYFVVKVDRDGGRRAIEIKKNALSIFCGYSLFLLPLIDLGAILFIGSSIDNIYLGISGFIALAALNIYYFTFMRWSSKKEKFIRECFYKTMGIAVAPYWLYEETLVEYHERFKQIYENKYGCPDWEDRLNKMGLQHPDYQLAYCLTALEYEVESTKERKLLLDTIYEQYKASTNK